MRPPRPCSSVFAVFVALPLAAQQAPKDAPFAAYREKIPASDAAFDLVPIPAGKFMMGSPAGEGGRNANEGPQVEVTVEAFWMGRCEVTWEEYDQFNTDTDRPQAKKPDGVSRPTPAYTEMTFGMGREGYPAIGMSHIAAREYCAWLGKKTGRFYRLPTEAEWEYACRAGSTSAYSFGDDPKALDEYAVYAGNSPRPLEQGAAPKPAYQKVGLKKANAWGLHDMHGNVAEWVADTFLADLYAETNGKAPRSNPYFPPGRDAKDRPIRFPHTVRGGSFQDGPEALRSAARRPSEPGWNQRDPQIPKSWWYLTEGQHLGFRVVRPVREPTAAERAKFENP